MSYSNNALRSICQVKKLKKRSSDSLDKLWERINSNGGAQNSFRSYLVRIEDILKDRPMKEEKYVIEYVEIP